MTMKSKAEKRVARRRRVRAKIFGTAARPRLCVHRSNTQLRAQIINDEKGETICAVSSASESAKTPLERVVAAGAKIAELAKKNKVTTVVFDRGGFSYNGSIKAFADSAREAGLTF